MSSWVAMWPQARAPCRVFLNTSREGMGAPGVWVASWELPQDIIGSAGATRFKMEMGAWRDW